MTTTPPTCYLFGAVSPEEIEIFGKTRHRIYFYDYCLFKGEDMDSLVWKVKMTREKHGYSKPKWGVLDAKYGTRTEMDSKTWEDELRMRGLGYIRLSQSKPGDVELGHKLVREYLKFNHSTLTGKTKPGILFAKEGCRGQGGPIHHMFNYQYKEDADKPSEKFKDFPDIVRYMCMEQPVFSNTEADAVLADPTDLPGPIGIREPRTVRIDLETVEVEGQLADGTTFKYWTFNGQVPGPFYRVRVGDTIEVHLKNLTDSTMAHSVDFHAVTGPGGGATMTQTAPGEETMFTAKALNPGLYVYHCATPMVAQHIANGMYGLILVEPEEGLPPVDREFYVMQGEIYTNEAFGSTGLLTENNQTLLNEDPEYLVFNGAVGGLTEQKPLKANVGETVRVFFGVGGPNFTSSFHVIGEIFDRVYDQASLTSPHQWQSRTIYRQRD